MTEARGGATVVTIIITMWRDIGFNRQHWSAHSLLPPVLTAAQLQVNKKNIQINVAKLMTFLLLILPFFPTSCLPTFQIFLCSGKNGFYAQAQYTLKAIYHLENIVRKY